MNSHFSVRPLTPQTADEMRAAETIQGKRRRIHDYAHESALVHAVMNTAYAHGLSGEDTMTLLAYTALLRLEKLEGLLLDEAMVKPSPTMIAP